MRRHDEVQIEVGDLVFLKHGLDAGKTRHHADFVKVGHDGGGAMLEHGFREGTDGQVGAFRMDMPVDEARGDEGALGVDRARSFTDAVVDVTDRREATVTVTTANGCKVLHLLLDSGNLVREPISGKYVLIVGLDAAAPLLTDAERRAIADGDADALLRRRFRLICARGMDGTPRTLYGFVPDSIVYTDGKKSVKLDTYLAPTPTETGFCGFEGIAHPSAIA